MNLPAALRWLPGYAATPLRRRRPRADQPVHLLLCIADHFEPANGGASDATARRRVASWVDLYPKMFGDFRDADGRPPRHSFFYPMEQYVRSDIEALADLCRGGFGEVEIHLHHDRDNPDNLRQRLLQYRQILAHDHGLLGRDRQTGQPMYGFIHGDWALCNALLDGAGCGVNDELTILHETGCYADFTLPAFPSPAQTCRINSIYYASSNPHHPRGHDRGVDIGAAPPPQDALMLIQGPLVLRWNKRKWGILPRVENGCVQANQPLHADRIDDWLRAAVRVAGRPDWFFVKLHTHGAPEANAAALIGESAVRFHQALAARAAAQLNFHYHYVTAREMFNLALAAASGFTGPLASARDFRLQLQPTPASASAARPNCTCTVCA